MCDTRDGCARPPPTWTPLGCLSTADRLRIELVVTVVGTHTGRLETPTEQHGDLIKPVCDAGFYEISK